jgi:thymidylate synthase (FAD)
MTFLSQRLEHDAQFEIQEYAKAVRDLSEQVFPQALKALSNEQ